MTGPIRIAARMAAVAAWLAVPALAHAGEEVWKLDNLHRLGGRAVTVEGAPRVVRWKGGKAIAFDGVDDNLLIKGRPLVGAGQFTIEAIVRPDGGEFEQRFLHVAETDPVTGVDVRPVGNEHDVNHRIMFELRAVPDGFYIDGFINSKAGNVALAFPEKLHATGQWHVLTQSYDGSRYRTYVDRQLQGEVDFPFVPQGAGNVRIGSRMNDVSYFKGAIACIRFNDRALAPGEFLTLSNAGARGCGR